MWQVNLHGLRVPLFVGLVREPVELCMWYCRYGLVVLGVGQARDKNSLSGLLNVDPMHVKLA